MMKHISCLNIVNIFIALILWVLILYGVGQCQEFYCPKDTTDLPYWNEFFSREGTFLVVCDTSFVRDDSLHLWVHFYISTGDPKNVYRESMEYVAPLGKKIIPWYGL